MGTRSITRIFKNKEIICCIYRQFDGYLEGHGKELKTILKGHKICFGIKHTNTWNDSFNGMGCLAATVIHKLKKDIGGIYICPQDWYPQGWNYDIWNEEENIYIKVESYGDVVYEGLMDEFMEKEVADAD